MVVVGQLMGQYVPQCGGICCRFLCNINGGAEQAHKAGRGQAHGCVHRHRGAGALQRTAHPAQADGKAYIGDDEDHRHNRRPGGPDPPQKLQRANLLRVAGDSPALVLQSGVAEGIGGLDPSVLRKTDAGLLCRFGLHRQDIDALLPQGLRRLYGGQSYDREAEQGHWHQQPRQHNRPQAVPQSRADPLPQNSPEKQYGQDQETGGGDPFHHDLVSPSSAFRRISRSSAISSGLSSCRWAMALIISPTLPRYTRSRKERVSWISACSCPTAGV